MTVVGHRVRVDAQDLMPARTARLDSTALSGGTTGSERGGRSEIDELWLQQPGTTRSLSFPKAPQDFSRVVPGLLEAHVSSEGLSKTK